MASLEADRTPGVWSFPATTAIGSLPHHNVDAALAFSFQLAIPFLPQIPIRNPWEYMIPQALEGLPGLQVEGDGSTLLDVDVWAGRSRAFNERLLAAFSEAARPDAFAAFEPSAATSSSWQPFLWECEERAVKVAKVQIAGPLTAQWSLRAKDGSSLDRHPELASQIYRLVLARGMAMVRRLKADGIDPLIYLDEPALYALSATQSPALALQEVRLLVQALKKEGALVGLHCCSDTDWASVLGLGLDFVSLDTQLSLASLLARTDEVTRFVEAGGRFSLGVIPTPKSPGALQRLSANDVLDDLVATARVSWKGQPALLARVFERALYTPACGLALHSVGDAEAVLAALVEMRALGLQALRSRL